jgi:hypothetical protein
MPSRFSSFRELRVSHEGKATSMFQADEYRHGVQKPNPATVWVSAVDVALLHDCKQTV